MSSDSARTGGARAARYLNPHPAQDTRSAAVTGLSAPTGMPGRRCAARVSVTAQDRGYLPVRETVSPHRDIMMIRIMALTWSPVTESNRRPSPYHACRFRLMPSGWVGLPQVGGNAVSEYVAPCLLSLGAVVIPEGVGRCQGGSACGFVSVAAFAGQGNMASRLLSPDRCRFRASGPSGS